MLPVYLILWVDHERPASCLGHQDAVFYGHSVMWQTLCVPLLDDKLVAKNIDEAEVGADWDAQFLALFYPLVDELDKGGKHIYEGGHAF